MSKYSKLGKVAPCGSMDSKYFGKPEQFEKDIEDKLFSDELFKANLRALILENPSMIKERYHQAIKVMTSIKEEFKL